ncbi:hypothetical protein [Gryllotalpicola protaetiae]|uniref:Uncharacterized protein n=1 Tax=Gryllotalpicola protaetiae TaxID=2419771 RepID=A0A387BN33_9MICO|nr:hypothetical protein [Gryllotalpicola protaetiae]AYG03434.1 hypothetical protein D7I44_07715 [Gryllotalpicola protaetiae]
MSWLPTLATAVAVASGIVGLFAAASRYSEPLRIHGRISRLRDARDASTPKSSSATVLQSRIDRESARLAVIATMRVPASLRFFPWITVVLPAVSGLSVWWLLATADGDGALVALVAFLVGLITALAVAVAVAVLWARRLHRERFVQRLLDAAPEDVPALVAEIEVSLEEIDKQPSGKSAVRSA